MAVTVFGTHGQLTHHYFRATWDFEAPASFLGVECVGKPVYTPIRSFDNADFIDCKGLPKILVSLFSNLK